MNEFDKRMADLSADRRRKFWDDVWFWTIEVLCGLAALVIVGLIIWIA